MELIGFANILLAAVTGYYLFSVETSVPCNSPNNSDIALNFTLVFSLTFAAHLFGGVKGILRAKRYTKLSKLLQLYPCLWLIGLITTCIVLFSEGGRICTG